MSNHPNRGKAPKRCRTPKPEEIRLMREKHGLTQTQAAELVCASLNAWQQWEAPEHTSAMHRRMHPGFWRLFLLSVGESV